MVCLAAALWAGCVDEPSIPSEPDGGADAATGHADGDAVEDIQTRVAQAKRAFEPVVRAHCERLLGCCDAEELPLELHPTIEDAEECTSYLLDGLARDSLFTMERPFALPLPPQVHKLFAAAYEPNEPYEVLVDRVDACAQEIAARGCAEPPSDGCSERDLRQKSACDELIVGRLEEGERCFDEGCAPGLICAGPNYDEGVCVPAATEGDLCGHTEACASPLVCDPLEGRCVEGARQGEACAYADPEEPLPGSETIRCADGLVCDPVTLRCRDPFCATGSSCVRDGDCPDEMLCIDGTCAQRAKAGDHCLEHDDCEAFLRCDGWYCQPMRGLNEPCSEDEECLNGDCRYDPSGGYSMCAGPTLDGEACTFDEQCASGFCMRAAAQTTGTCEPQAPVGDPCSPEHSSPCHEGRCRSTVVGEEVEWRCEAGGQAGDSCEEGSDDCVNNSRHLRCDERKCTPYPFADGHSCEENWDCASQSCVEATCVAEGAQGAGCSSDRDCQDSLYCSRDPAAEFATCVAFKNYGERCSSVTECWPSRSTWNTCVLIGAEQRCISSAPDAPVCSGG